MEGSRALSMAPFDFLKRKGIGRMTYICILPSFEIGMLYWIFLYPSTLVKSEEGNNQRHYDLLESAGD